MIWYSIFITWRDTWRVTLWCLGVWRGVTQRNVRNFRYTNLFSPVTVFFHVTLHYRDVYSCDENGISRHDLLVFGFLYGSLAFIYNYILVNYERTKEIFEIVCIYCSRQVKVNNMNLNCSRTNKIYTYFYIYYFFEDFPHSCIIYFKY